MPLAPQFVQEVSEQRIPQYGYVQRQFTNLSSQQATPGLLPSFFQQQTNMLPMPFGVEDLNVPNNPIVEQISERNNVSNLPRAETLTADFDMAAQSKERRFRTGNMRAWGVPLGMTELRATDTTF